MVTKCLRQEDYKVVPWKNGLGTTLELASALAAGSENTAGFLWRISIADMVQSNEFSLFPNTSRVLTVVSGEGMVLKEKEAGNSHACLPFNPVSFPGSTALYGELMHGPVQNFNVMVDSRCASAVVRVIETAGDISLFGSVNYFYLLPGSCAVSFSSGEGAMVVRAGESYLTEASGNIRVDRVQAEAELPLKFMHVRLSFKE